MTRRRSSEGARGWQPPTHDRWTLEDGDAMVAALEDSGLSATRFARTHGVGLHRVRYWQEKVQAEAQRRGSEGGVSGFVPIQVVAGPGSGDASADQLRVEVELESGVRLAFSGGWTTEAIVPWLRALEAIRC